MKNVVLSPIGTSTGNILEDALKECFELPKYCPRIRSDVTMASIKTHKARYAKQRSTRMTRRPASVYAGTCETPAVYASEMHYVFENRNLSNEKILVDYGLRKAAFVRDQAAEKAFESRSEPLYRPNFPVSFGTNFSLYKQKSSHRELNSWLLPSDFYVYGEVFLSIQRTQNRCFGGTSIYRE